MKLTATTPSATGTPQGGIVGSIDHNANNELRLYGDISFDSDANGNVGQLVNAADGALAAHYEYDPFSKLLAASGPEADQNPFRFSTKYFDAETGLSYYGYRDYSPEPDRFRPINPFCDMLFS